ncbi:DUF4260 family protein [Aquirufa rosea]|uniref:DUF4260 family protein n=1 Tax=Aquirufa rosea TaxID=2509241 RepID=A0A4Q1BZF1_9BACT|nr:DUF4260 family protein [Aquirufa rosea]RXK48924.1 DUF4260 family protein [Aquirufa rosea]
MRNILKLESLGLFCLSLWAYFQFFPNQWGTFAWLILAPDLSFLAIIISKKLALQAYNLCHHQGLIALAILWGFYSDQSLLLQIGIIFMCHSTFDRIIGYGLKLESFEHTHLGWIGKSKFRNEEI